MFNIVPLHAESKFKLIMGQAHVAHALGNSCLLRRKDHSGW
jgi:hypothetical protein